MSHASAEEIEQLHRELNAPGRLPERYYRRNVVQYELVSYLASTVALWTSGNYSALITFLDRAHDAFGRLLPHLDVEYASFVSRYLRVVSHYLAASEHISTDEKARLPADLIQELQR